LQRDGRTSSRLWTISFSMESRTNLGSLTTVFTPPPACFTPYMGGWAPGTPLYNSLLWGIGCSLTSYTNGGFYEHGWSTACYPSGMFYESVFMGANTVIAAGQGQSIAVYSPGLSCPQGFSSACTVTKQPGDQPPATEPLLWSALATGETAIGCCPS
jgi:hypothetical protein